MPVKETVGSRRMESCSCWRSWICVVSWMHSCRISLIFIAKSISYFRGQRCRFVESNEEKKMSGC